MAHGPKQWQLGNGFAANEQIMELSNHRQGPAVHGKSTAAAEGVATSACAGGNSFINDRFSKQE